MTARELFELVVRLGGVVSAAMAFFDVYHVVLSLIGAPYPSHWGVTTDSFAALGFLILGVALFAGAPLLATLAYGRRPNSN